MSLRYMAADRSREKQMKNRRSHHAFKTQPSRTSMPRQGLLLVFSFSLIVALGLSMHTPPAGSGTTPELLSLPHSEDFFDIGRIHLVEATTTMRVSEIHAALAAYRTGLPVRDEERLAVVISEQADRYQVDPALVLALIRIESAFNPWSISARGAVGLIQVLPTTGRSVARDWNLPFTGMASLYDPEENVAVGLGYLSDLRDRFGRIDLALSAYNVGPSRVRDRMEHGLPVPMRYSKRVLDEYRQIQTIRKTAASILVSRTAS